MPAKFKAGDTVRFTTPHSNVEYGAIGEVLGGDSDGTVEVRFIGGKKWLVSDCELEAIPQLREDPIAAINTRLDGLRKVLPVFLDAYGQKHWLTIDTTARIDELESLKEYILFNGEEPEL
jgi:hypothetical protein